MNVPGIFVYAGTIKPGFWKGDKLTIVSPFEAVGAFAAGNMSKEDFDGIEKNACPSVGACGGQYTANTMSSSFEALGMSLLESSQMASPDSEKAESAAASARVLVEAIRANLKPRDIITRKTIENAVALVMATGGSTNAVLHYLAIASAAAVKWSIDDFERVRRKVPVLCNLCRMLVRPRCLLWVACGRRLSKSFLTLLQHWSGAVTCAACLCGRRSRWP